MVSVASLVVQDFVQGWGDLTLVSLLVGCRNGNLTYRSIGFVSFAQVMESGRVTGGCEDIQYIGMGESHFGIKAELVFASHRSWIELGGLSIEELARKSIRKCSDVGLGISLITVSEFFPWRGSWTEQLGGCDNAQIQANVKKCTDGDLTLVCLASQKGFLSTNMAGCVFVCAKIGIWTLDTPKKNQTSMRF